MTSSAARSYLYERHALLVRITHWVNVVAFIVLLMSGLQIFNAHPNLYWGKSSYSGDPPLLRMTAKSAPNGERIGVTRVFGRDFETTGVFGLSRDSRGAWTERDRKSTRLNSSHG